MIENMKIIFVRGSTTAHTNDKYNIFPFLEKRVDFDFQDGLFSFRFR